MADNGTNWYLPRGFESSHSAFFFEDKKKIRFWKHPTQSFTRHRYQHVWTSKRHWYQFWYLIFVHLLHVKGIIIFSCCLRNSVIIPDIFYHLIRMAVLTVLPTKMVTDRLHQFWLFLERRRYAILRLDCIARRDNLVANPWNNNHLVCWLPSPSSNTTQP